MPTTSHSSLGIYVSSEEPYVTDECCRWKGAGMGPVTVQIHPADSGYSADWFYVGVTGFGFGYNSFQLSATLSEACNRELCDIAWIVPILELDQTNCTVEKGVVCRLKPGETAYFRHTVSAELPIILARATPSSVLLYGSPRFPQPVEENSQWTSRKRSAPSEIESTPFVINSEGLPEYHTEMGADLANELGKTGPQTAAAFSVETDQWQNEVQILYLGVHNPSKAVVDAEVSITGEHALIILCCA